MIMRVKFDLKLLPCGLSLVTALAALAVLSTTSPVQAADKKPNILVIIGDDVGWFNIGAYHRGMMSGKIP
jgi:ABC-type sugar transport system substrate-binding protein